MKYKLLLAAGTMAALVTVAVIGQPTATAFRGVFANHTVVDSEKRFVTGQNQNSGRATSQAMLLIFEERSAL